MRTNHIRNEGAEKERVPERPPTPVPQQPGPSSPQTGGPLEPSWREPQAPVAPAVPI